MKWLLMIVLLLMPVAIVLVYQKGQEREFQSASYFEGLVANGNPGEVLYAPGNGADYIPCKYVNGTNVTGLDIQGLTFNVDILNKSCIAQPDDNAGTRINKYELGKLIGSTSFMR